MMHLSITNPTKQGIYGNGIPKSDNTAFHRMTNDSISAIGTAVAVSDEKNPGQEAMVLYPTSIDVMCGTGHEKNHSGNELFKLIISQYVDQYSQASTKKAKMEVSKMILKRLSESGVRFLKKSTVTQYWHVATPKVARDKIGHFLRLHLPKPPPKKRATKSSKQVHQVGRAAVTTPAQHKEHQVPFIMPRSFSSPHLQTPVERSRNALRSFAAMSGANNNRNSKSSGNIHGCKLLLSNMKAAEDSQQIKKDLKYYSQYQESPSPLLLEQQQQQCLTPFSAPLDLSMLNGSSLYHSHNPTTDFLNKSTKSLYRKAKSNPFWISTTSHNIPTNDDAATQQTFHDKCGKSSSSRTIDEQCWPVQKTFRDERSTTTTTPSLKTKQPSQDVWGRHVTAIDLSAGASSTDWGRLLFAAACNSKDAGMEPFALDDADSGYNALELFDESELAVRLD